MPCTHPAGKSAPNSLRGIGAEGKPGPATASRDSHARSASVVCTPASANACIASRKGVHSRPLRPSNGSRYARASGPAMTQTSRPRKWYMRAGDIVYPRPQSSSAASAAMRASTRS
eukprot:15453705-Alexandrium_andersonii.AAC.1